MATSEALAIAGMLDEAGYDGVICADHLVYPRNLTSPFEMPSADLYRRAEDLGITAVMCAPWLAEGVEAGDEDRCRAAIERFAETVIAPCR
jgi:alkanesulfonate monooxygenase SsuD/methylene tetrahydromethanopterin reductase-like flavin-dependent oxidoreductase (luciferase family)